MKWKPLRNYLFPFFMDEVNRVKESYLELVQHIQYFNKEANKKEYLTYRKAIKLRIIEIDDFIEENYGKPFVMNFERGKLILMHLLTIQPTSTERQNKNYTNVEVDFNELNTKADDDDSQDECPCYNKLPDKSYIYLGKEKQKKVVFNKNNIRKISTDKKIRYSSQKKIEIAKKDTNIVAMNLKIKSKLPSKKISESKVGENIMDKVSKLNLNVINNIPNTITTSTKNQTKNEANENRNIIFPIQEIKPSPIIDKDKIKQVKPQKKINFYEKFKNKKYLKSLFPKSGAILYSKIMKFDDTLNDEIIYCNYSLTQDDSESSFDSFDLDISQTKKSDDSFRTDIKEITLKIIFNVKEYEFFLTTKANNAISLSYSKQDSSFGDEFAQYEDNFAI